MIKYKLYNGIALCLLLTSFIGFGQTRKERKADREFENYAYIDAIHVYENMADKGYVNTSILSRLGDSYYFNGKFIDAYKWYDQLFNSTYEGKDLNLLNPEYYYRFAQTLKAVGQPEQADAMLERFATIEYTDSRARLFLNNDELVELTQAASSYALVNLGINSSYSDYGGTLSENQLIFTSSRPTDAMHNKIHAWTNESYTKLYASSIVSDGTLEEPVLFAKELASKNLNMGSAIFTKDGQIMYFTSNKSPSRRNKKAALNQEDSSILQIYRAKKQADGRWGEVEALPINLEQYNTAHPALTPDEKWLYFASDRQGVQGSLGQLDLFRVALYEDGQYGTVENLGDQINTAGRETFPFISQDYVLYFATDGHPGFGGLDLYKVDIHKDGSLGKPVNLGPDINSRFDDFGLYIDSSTKKGFISSNRLNGQGGDDIYLFVEKPCIQVIEGTVAEKASQFFIADAEIIIQDRMQKQVDKVYSDARGHYFSDKLLCGQKYRIRIQKPGYDTQEFVVSTDRKSQTTLAIELEIDGTIVKPGDDLFAKMKLNPIHFDLNQSIIRPDAQIELMKIVEIMKQHPSLKLDIRSHTDSQGNDAYNMKLSERRANATMKWMISRGIDPGRLTGRGYGESQLINHCSNGVPCTEEEHEMNRRSEFIIVKFN